MDNENRNKILGLKLVSVGVSRRSDLTYWFLHTLKKHGWQVFNAVVAKAPAEIRNAFLEEYPSFPEDDEFWKRPDVVQFYNDLLIAMQSIAPENYHFGLWPGEEDFYGYWNDEMK